MQFEESSWSIYHLAPLNKVDTITFLFVFNQSRLMKPNHYQQSLNVRSLNARYTNETIAWRPFHFSISAQCPVKPPFIKITENYKTNPPIRTLYVYMSGPNSFFFHFSTPDLPHLKDHLWNGPKVTFKRSKGCPGISILLT